MGRLVLSLDGQLLHDVVLKKDRTTIGRRPHNDIVLSHPAVSAEHAVVVTLFNDSFLEDLHSTNGVQVNGHPARKHFLQDGDHVRIAVYDLLFFRDAGGAAVVAPAGKRLAGPAQTDGASPGPMTVVDVTPLLRVLDGPAAGKELRLTKPLTTIGRPGDQIAVVTRRGEEFFLTHVEGRNTPRVNGRAIGTGAYPLTSGDLIDLAGGKMAFLVET
ncbi:MAG: FHA domain-containing protein [Burkholderiaceae bacterium]